MEEKLLNFGQALEAIKEGKAVARSGWNGKKMSIGLNMGSIDRAALPEPSHPAGEMTHFGGVSLGLFESGDHGTVTRYPNINMKAADGATVTGWLASQTDMLAEDWNIVETS